MIFGMLAAAEDPRRRRLQDTDQRSRRHWIDRAAHNDEHLDDVAREAKKRLEHKLNKQFNKCLRNYRPRSSEGMRTIQSRIQDEVPTPKKSGSKRLKWLELKWKSSEQDECSVCLEQLRKETIMQLPCAHQFHVKCLGPWLEANSHCPCCRTQISRTGITS